MVPYKFICFVFFNLIFFHKHLFSSVNKRICSLLFLFTERLCGGSTFTQQRHKGNRELNDIGEFVWCLSNPTDIILSFKHTNISIPHHTGNIYNLTFNISISVCELLTLMEYCFSWRIDIIRSGFWGPISTMEKSEIQLSSSIFQQIICFFALLHTCVYCTISQKNIRVLENVV